MERTKRYAVTLKVFNDDDPSENESLKTLGEFDTYKDARECMLCEMRIESRVRSEDGHIVGTVLSAYAAHLFDYGIHLSFMIIDKENLYNERG